MSNNRKEVLQETKQNMQKFEKQRKLNWLHNNKFNTIKKGDFVVRKSHNKDVIFVVDLVINNQIAILSGITTRLKADSYLDDLEIVSKQKIQSTYKEIEARITNKASQKRQVCKTNFFSRSNKIIYTGKILHLDGDRKYSEKSNIYYKKMGLKAIVKNISENRQVNLANDLIDKYNPDIVVITGHDRYD